MLKLEKISQNKMEFEQGFKDNWKYRLCEPIIHKLALDDSYLQKMKITERLYQETKLSQSKTLLGNHEL